MMWIEIILSGSFLTLLGFVAKVTYDYGRLTKATENILDKLNEYIDRSDKRVDDLEDEVEALKEKLNEVKTTITELLVRCGLNHKE